MKVGCKVEKLQLAKKERIEKALVMAMIITWRVMYLMRLGCVCPDLPAELVFEPLEWKSSYVLLQKSIPKKAPTLNTVLRNLAALGGFLGENQMGILVLKAYGSAFSEFKIACLAHKWPVN